MADKKTRIDIYLERVQETHKLDPQVAITLNGRSLTLEFNNKALKGVLKDSGFNALSEGLSKQASESPEVMGSLLWRGLLKHHPELTVDEVDELFTSRHYPYILNRLRVALEMFMPDMSDVPAEKEGNENPPSQPVPLG